MADFIWVIIVLACVAWLARYAHFRGYRQGHLNGFNAGYNRGVSDSLTATKKALDKFTEKKG